MRAKKKRLIEDGRFQIGFSAECFDIVQEVRIKVLIYTPPVVRNIVPRGTTTGDEKK
tara:strand:- start:667 stop:837 length:171 start_codon:yes stop_codon:yes gene_type:complete